MAGFFDNLGKTITDAGNSTLQKGRGMADTAKLNSQIKEEEKKINDFYAQIGKMYYDAHGEEPEESLAPLVAEVTACRSRIQEYKNKISELKGEAVCPNCGAGVPSGSLFCAACGAKIEVQPIVKETPATKFCTSCGAPLSEGVRFCTSCGQPVDQ